MNNVKKYNDNWNVWERKLQDNITIIIQVQFECNLTVWQHVVVKSVKVWNESNDKCYEIERCWWLDEAKQRDRIWNWGEALCNIHKRRKLEIKMFLSTLR